MEQGNNPTATEAESNSIAANPDFVDQEIAKMFGDDQSQSTQPAEKENPQQSPEPQNPKEGQGQSQSVQPQSSTQPPQSQDKIDPAKAFEEGSKRAFCDDKGEIDTRKLSDFFTSSEKSFTRFNDEPIRTTVSEEKTERPDPVKKYRDAVDEVILNWDKYHKGEMDKGFSSEDATAHIRSHLEYLRGEMEKDKSIAVEIEQRMRTFAPELEQVKQDRMQANIDRNVAEFASICENVIPGVDGYSALNRFLLDPKYGGNLIDALLLKENPGLKNLPAEKQKEITAKWFKDFQQDRRSMSMVLRYGQMAWLVSEQMPTIIEHAKRTGINLLKNGNEAGMGKVSSLTSQEKQQVQKNSVEEFFGVPYDRVT